MKRLTLVVVFTLLSATASQAQIKSYGFKSGLSLANQELDFKSELEFSPSLKRGINIGLFAEWFDWQHFSFLTEVHYVQKGMSERLEVTTFGPEPIGTLKFGNRVDYLSFPFLMKLSSRKKKFEP